MTATERTELVCDVCGATETHLGPVHRVRVAAVSRGWTMRGDAFEDVCPLHPWNAPDGEPAAWDDTADQDAPCQVIACGHPYYRHFDTYDDMAAVGCKRCPCPAFLSAERLRGR